MNEIVLKFTEDGTNPMTGKRKLSIEATGLSPPDVPYLARLLSQINEY